MVEETNRPNDLAFLENPDLSLGFLASNKIGRIADDLLSPDSFFSRTDTDELAIFVGDNLVDGFIEHVGTTVNGGKAGEGLREFSKSVERVDVGRLAIASHGGGIQDDTLVGGAGGFGNVTTRNVRKKLR